MIFRLDTPVRFLWTSAVFLYAKMAGYKVLAEPEEVEKRVLRCEICRYFTESRQCRVCTCFIDGKAAIAVEGCPKGFWRSVWEKKSGKLG